jgi:hypothetical protein
MRRWPRLVELSFVCLLLYLFETFVLYFDTPIKLLDIITLFTLVLLRPIRGVIFGVFGFYYSVLPFVPL